MHVYIKRCLKTVQDAGMIDQKMLIECSVYNMLEYVYNMLGYLKDAELSKVRKR